MAYHLDARKMGLEDVVQRLRGTDLIPSQLPLLEDLPDNIAALERVGMVTVADLRAAMKNPGMVQDLAKVSGVDADWLILLNRALKGFFPKPRPIKEFEWVSAPLRTQLKAEGLTNSELVFETYSEALPEGGEVETLLATCDLCRIQWVSPSFARALVASGFVTAADLARADPEDVATALAKVNVDGRFFKGKVGLRDIRRLVVAAQYAPQS
ncbi:DUF4332 domain-containing protein [Aliiroseovarius subalbicans]|uniref:DUF4332 domain-containing protein n=1 Tax=Aliiroseovarius subalbicans TaxID=2925840 RepID=UPI001F58A529|nr:DUF4332 domain-containing protein [Aliiroseovarius subalbicans]MCI2397913.1 DUF4332 domain-containing protein [Aliiroseovarius subalbicans]